MLNVTTDQALQRWDLLPIDLREALYSESNSDFLWKTSHDEHIPDEKVYEIAKVAGYVLMGFLHPEDLALEIVERLTLDRKTASNIQDALNKRVFAPLQADLDKVYNPLSKFEMTSGPKIIQEAPLSGPAPQTVFKAVSNAAPVRMPTPLAPMPAPMPIVPPAPKPLSSTVAAPSSTKVISAVLSSIPSASSSSGTKIPSPLDGKFAPFVPAQPQGASSLPQTGWSKSVTTSTPATTAATAPSSDPAPVMLHQDAKFSSSQKTTDFHLARPGGGAEVSLEGVKSQQTVKPAVLELGSLANAPAKPTTSPAPKFTHYSQFEASGQPANRQVTEITTKPLSSPMSVGPTTPLAPAMPIPQPPKPPTSSVLPTSSSALPPPPMPPKPPVVKNYL
jgi:hypothetical protein